MFPESREGPSTAGEAEERSGYVVLGEVLPPASFLCFFPVLAESRGVIAVAELSARK
jgi:hypothetical protein